MARIRLTIDLDTKHGGLSEETLEAIGEVNLKYLFMDALREFQKGRGVNGNDRYLNVEMARCYVDKRYTHDTSEGETRTFGERGSERFEKKALQVARRSHIAEFIANNIDSIGFDEPDDSTGDVVDQLAEVLNRPGLLDPEDFHRAHGLAREARRRSRKEHFPYMRQGDRDVLLMNLRRFLEVQVRESDVSMLPTNENYHRYLVGNIIKWVENREPTGKTETITKVEKCPDQWPDTIRPVEPGCFDDE